MAEQHLWEAEHPYYAQEGNFYKAGEHYRADSWSEFFAEMGDSDDDLNLVYRWDWKQDDATEGNPPGHGTLFLYYMAQRKARCFSYEAAVTAADEPAVREWLQKKAEHMRRIWAPFA
jgi:hypothetical protein